MYVANEAKILSQVILEINKEHKKKEVPGLGGRLYICSSAVGESLPPQTRRMSVWTFQNFAVWVNSWHVFFAF